MRWDINKPEDIRQVSGKTFYSFPEKPFGFHVEERRK